MRFEDPIQMVRGDPLAVIGDADLRATTLECAHVERDLTRVGQAGVLEQIQQHIAQFSVARRREHRRSRDPRFPRGALGAHPLQFEHITRHGTHIHGHGRRVADGRRAVATEGPRDLVQTIDFPEHARDVLFERRIEVHARVAPCPQEMLHAETHRRERVLDLVRHLPRHLPPREHALRTRHIGHVVERDHHPARVGCEACHAHLESSPFALGLERVVLHSRTERLDPLREFRPDGLCDRHPAHDRPTKDRLGARVREGDAPRVVQRDDAAGHVAQRRGQAPLGRFEGRPALGEIGGHALEGTEDGHELHRRIGREALGCFPSRERERAAPQFVDRPRELARDRAARPDRRQTAEREREEQEDRQVVAATVEQPLVEARRRGEHDLRSLGIRSGAISETHGGRSDRLTPTRRGLVALRQRRRDPRGQESAHGRDRVEQRVTRADEESVGIEEERRVEALPRGSEVDRVRRAGRAAERLTHEQVARLPIVRLHALERPEPEEDGGQQEARVQGETHPRAKTLQEVAPPHPPPAPQHPIGHDDQEPDGAEHREVAEHQQGAARDERIE